MTLAIAMFVAEAWCPGASMAAPSFDEQVAEINADARELREKGELEQVEKKRRDRWKLIAEAAGKKTPPDSLWIEAYRAIEKVDGSEESTTAETGLLNALKYRESCDVLKKAFDDMAAKGDAALLGELATRYFEVAQQAKGVYRDALVAGSRDQVTDVADIVRCLEIAKDRDPCCVAAVAMLLYLEKPDPRETFLRAEVRGSFRKRQKQLVELSHPLILPSLQSRSDVLAFVDDVDAKPDDTKKVENVDAPVMPWHAAVELDKAMSLQFILEDLRYTRPLTPDFTVLVDVDEKGPDNKPVTVQYPLYTFPSQVFAGTDAGLSPCCLLYGKMLLARSSEGEGGSRSVAYFPVTNNAKKSVAWDWRGIDLIYRVPAAEELDKNPILKRKHEFVTAYAPRAKWKLGDEEFRLYDFPIRDAERCLQVGMQVFCIRSKDDLRKLKFIPLRNKPDAVAKLETPLDRQFPNPGKMPFATTELVRSALGSFAMANDPTKHALIELMRNDYLNPLVLVSERKAGSKASSPNLFAGDAAGEPPYIKLDDGSKLQFALEGMPDSPCCLIASEGATAYFPLVDDAIPQPVLLGSEIGKAFVGALVNAGYTESQAVAEIKHAMVTTNYVPEKFRKALEARVKAEKADAIKKGLGPGAVKVDAVLSKMLAEVGWQGDPELKPALEQLFSLYGFRYLRDRRNNWILVRELTEEDGSGTDFSFGWSRRQETDQEKKNRRAERQKEMDEQTARFPYAYIAQDGKQSIDVGQIYSWTAYQQLKDSIYAEHLRKVLAFHPSLAVIEVIDADFSERLQHPSEHRPDYIKKVESSASQQANSGSPGGVKETGDVPDLKSPFPKWVVEEDTNQAKSLAALHAAYVQQLTALSVEARRMSSAEALRRFYEQRYLAAVRWIDAMNALEGMDLAQTAFNGAASRRQRAVETLQVVQLESGRDYARRRYFHKSIVWYNDLLAQLASGGGRASRVMIFSDVPTTDTASLFVNNLQNMIQSQSFVLNTQIELAGVLNASGLRPSAQFVWQRTVDDYDFFLKPAVDVARDLMESYGLRLSDRAQQTLRQLDETVGMCRKAIDKYGLAVDWRQLAGEKAMAGDKNRRRNAAAVRDDLERDNLGKLSNVEREQLDKECEAISGDRSIGLSEWLEWKKALLELRPTLALRTTWFSPPWLGSQCSYDTDEGFVDVDTAARELIVKAKLPAIAAWSKKPLEEANKDPIAADASAILGWYWLDVGQLPAARAAFMNLARVKFAAAKQRRESLEELLDELHGYVALTAAGAIVESMPGLSAFKSDFGSLLEGQLRGWEKRWFAKGHYGPHASQQRLEILARAAQVQRQLAGMSRDWRRNRYFFPDYSFEFGAVPDFFVQKLFKSPELFKTIGADEVKKMEESAVEGNKWALIEKSDAINFMNTFKLKTVVEEDIVFLGK